MSKYRLKYQQSNFQGSTDDQTQVQQHQLNEWKPKVEKPGRNECIPVKYKTEMCKNFEQNGRCPYRQNVNTLMDTISSSANRPQRKAIELENAIPFGTKDYVLMGKDVNSLTTKFNPPQEFLNEDNFPQKGYSKVLNKIFI